jgi:hypothetical protein
VAATLAAFGLTACCGAAACARTPRASPQNAHDASSNPAAAVAARLSLFLFDIQNPSLL